MTSLRKNSKKTSQQGFCFNIYTIICEISLVIDFSIKSYGFSPCMCVTGLTGTPTPTSGFGALKSAIYEKQTVKIVMGIYYSNVKILYI